MLKKKKKETSISDIIFKIIVIITIGIFGLTIINLPEGSLSLSDNKLRQGGSGNYGSTTKKSTDEKDAPSQLKWFDSFKGISNGKDKEEEKEMKYFK